MHALNAHAQVNMSARYLGFGRNVDILHYVVCANSDGYDETALTRMLVRAIAGRKYIKYNFRVK